MISRVSEEVKALQGIHVGQTKWKYSHCNLAINVCLNLHKRLYVSLDLRGSSHAGFLLQIRLVLVVGECKLCNCERCVPYNVLVTCKSCIFFRLWGFLIKNPRNWFFFVCLWYDGSIIFINIFSYDFTLSCEARDLTFPLFSKNHMC